MGIQCSVPFESNVTPLRMPIYTIMRTHAMAIAFSQEAPGGRARAELRKLGGSFRAPSNH